MNVEDTIKFVIKAHGNQLYADCPYIVHLMLVARHFSDETLIKISLLHDVLEDTDVEEKTLRFWFGDEITNAVVELTHVKKEDYLKEYIPRVTYNRLATLVKIADLTENLFSLVNFYPGRYEHLYLKYSRAKAFLENFIEGKNDVTNW